LSQAEIKITKALSPFLQRFSDIIFGLKSASARVALSNDFSETATATTTKNEDIDGGATVSATKEEPSSNLLVQNSKILYILYSEGGTF
jgi:hypothetical protein